MIYIVDKVCNYLIYVFLIHYCWKIGYRKNWIFRIISGLTCVVAGLVDAYFGEVTPLIYFVWCLTAVILLFDDNVFHISILACALTLFMGMMDTFSEIVVQILLLGSADSRSEIQAWQLCAYVVSFVIEFSYYYFILRKNDVYLNEINLTYKITILIMTLAFEMVVVNVFDLYYSTPADYSWYLHFRFALCLLGAVYAIGVTLKLAVNNYVVSVQNQELKTALEVEENHYLYQKEKNINLRRFRHDLINHIGVIKELLSQKQYENANVYIDKIWNITESLSDKISTGDDYIDAIINYYGYICEKESVDLEVKGKLSCPIGMEMVDITTLFGNALQNAVEANRRLEKKYIKVEIIDKYTEVFISIYNACTDKKVSTDYMTDKHFLDKESHGLGLGKIVSIVRKYRGEYYISVEVADIGKLFKIDISLPRKECIV